MCCTPVFKYACDEERLLFVVLNRIKCNVRMAEVVITRYEPIKYIAFSAIRLLTLNWLLSYVNIIPSIYAVSAILYFGYGQHSSIKMV